MNAKPKTSRDLTARPTKSAIPRSEGALFLMLNRLATDRERLQTNEAALLVRLEQVRKHIARIEGEIQYYKDRIEVYNHPSTPAVRKTPSVKSLFPENDSEEEEETTQWQAITVEY
jgi:predicted  nucleic acid-binding Zn-ribbon protein